MQVTIIRCPRCRAIGIFDGHDYKTIQWKCPNCDQFLVNPETTNADLKTEPHEPKMSEGERQRFFDMGTLNALSLMWDARQPGNLYPDNSTAVERQFGFEKWWKAKAYIRRTA